MQQDLRTIRDDIACGNRDFGILNTSTNAHRTLVDILVDISKFSCQVYGCAITK